VAIFVLHWVATKITQTHKSTNAQNLARQMHKRTKLGQILTFVSFLCVFVVFVTTSEPLFDHFCAFAHLASKKIWPPCQLPCSKSKKFVRLATLILGKFVRLLIWFVRLCNFGCHPIYIICEHMDICNDAKKRRTGNIF
jgi:hypothetical protein